MIDVILPNNISEILSNAIKKKVVVEKVVVLEGYDDLSLVYRYRFTLTVDDTPTTVVIEANVEDLFDKGTNVTDFLLSSVAKKINDRTGGGEAKVTPYTV